MPFSIACAIGLAWAWDIISTLSIILFLKDPSKYGRSTILVFQCGGGTSATSAVRYLNTIILESARWPLNQRAW